LALFFINRLRLEYDGLYPVLTAAFVLVLFEGTSLIGGSGFLAAYVAGLTMANSTFIHKGSIQRFHDALAWLGQIIMFVVFGLLVFPSALPSIAWQGLLIAAILAFLARPVAVALTLLPFRLPPREVAFTSWIGLRGATPIILATFPLVQGIAGAETIFNVVFFVVLTSVLVQGTTVSRAAKLFKVGEDAPVRRSRSHEVVISEDMAHNLHEVNLPDGAVAVGRAVFELGLPEGVLIALLYRNDTVYVPQGGTVLAPGDVVLLVAENDYDYARARRVLLGDDGAV
jgi:cell volume regulation protein A